MIHYLKTWDFMRVLRLALGIFIIVQSAVARDWFFVGAGVLFSLMPVMNIGCCGASGRNTPIRKSNEKIEDVSYEEIR